MLLAKGVNCQEGILNLILTFYLKWCYLINLRPLFVCIYGFWPFLNRLRKYATCKRCGLARRNFEAVFKSDWKILCLGQLLWGHYWTNFINLYIFFEAWRQILHMHLFKNWYLLLLTFIQISLLLSLLSFINDSHMYLFRLCLILLFYTLFISFQCMFIKTKTCNNYLDALHLVVHIIGKMTTAKSTFCKMIN